MTINPPDPSSLLRMTTAFYESAVADELIGDMFAKAASDHAAHLASWLSVVFGGPRDYLRERGDLGFVMYKHMGLAITEPQRARWARLMMDAAAREFADNHAFLRRFDHFVQSITRSVREVTNIEPEELRRMIGLAPGEDMLPLKETGQ